MKFDCCFAVLLAACCCLPTAFGQRTPWTESRVVGSPDAPKPYHIERVYPKLEFRNPVELMPLGNSGKMMLLELDGKLYTFDDDPNVDHADLALDLRPLMADFRRSFGFGVHPNFDQNRQIFVVYAGPVEKPAGSRLSRFTVKETSPPTIDPDSEELLLTWVSGGHNGCAIRFDSHGYLYFSAGDGSRPFPPDEYNVSQDLSDLRATICRIDVDHTDDGRNYRIPADNPFVDLPGARPEIWAYGFRNPWRFTIDPATDRLFCGDVGWELWELIHDVRRGGNYGWSIMEGPQPIRSDIKPGPTPIRKPLVAYPHAVGQSVTGGIVYHGQALPELEGSFLYGDYVTGLVWGIQTESQQVTSNPVLAETGLAIITFAESRKGEPLIVDYGGGIYQLVKNKATEPSQPFPHRLSETGLFTETSTLEPSPGVLTYDLAAKAWQSGTDLLFHVGIPGSATVKISQRQRNWQYPKGTVFTKTISKDGFRVETQMLHFDGINWQPYSYVWSDEQTDATLVEEEGLERSLPDGIRIDGKSTWTIANRAQCRVCHGRQNGGAVGFTLENLDHGDQVDRLVALQVLDRRAPPAWNVARMVDPADASASLQQRARSYLTANCAHCHRRGGGGTVPMDVAYSTPAEEMNALSVPPTQGDFGIDHACVIAPGDPYRSVLFYRMATSGAGHMPKLWMRENDEPGLRLVHDWIAQMNVDSARNTPATEPGDGVDTRPTTTSDALRLFAKLLSSPSENSDRVRVAKQITKQSSPVIASLFERFLPPDLRRERLGPNIDPKQILAMDGDQTRGRELFRDGQIAQCINCHRLQGSGASVGPDLDGIAIKRTRVEILESILNPSATVEPAYQNLAVLTVDGNVITGMKVSESEHDLTIRSADGKDHVIDQDDVDSIRVLPTSLMPVGLAEQMTADELADLLAFLCSLKS